MISMISMLYRIEYQVGLHYLWVPRYCASGEWINLFYNALSMELSVRGVGSMYCTVSFSLSVENEQADAGQEKKKIPLFS